MQKLDLNVQSWTWCITGIPIFSSWHIYYKLKQFWKGKLPWTCRNLITVNIPVAVFLPPSCIDVLTNAVVIYLLNSALIRPVCMFCRMKISKDFSSKDNFHFFFFKKALVYSNWWRYNLSNLNCSISWVHGSPKFYVFLAMNSYSPMHWKKISKARSKEQGLLCTLRIQCPRREYCCPLHQHTACFYPGTVRACIDWLIDDCL